MKLANPPRPSPIGSAIGLIWIGYTELDRKDKVCILKETHWRNLSCQRAERDAVTQMNLNIKS